MTISSSQKRSRILAVSAGWIGVPYRWSGTTRSGVDCSGLTMNVYAAAAGIRLPHYSAAQYLMGKKVSQDQAQAGDLVFFGTPIVSHVGIYLGGGMVRHAPHTGAYVRDESLSTIGVPLAGFRNYLGDVGKDTTVKELSPGETAGPGTILPAPTTGTSSSSTRRPTSASNVAAAHGIGFSWNPLSWPGAAASSLFGGVASDVEHAAMEAVLYGSLLATGVGLVLIGAATTARKTQQSSPIPPMSLPGGGGGGSGGGTPALPAEIPPIPA